MCPWTRATSFSTRITLLRRSRKRGSGPLICRSGARWKKTQATRRCRITSCSSTTASIRTANCDRSGTIGRQVLAGSLDSRRGDMASDYPSKFIILGYFVDKQEAGNDDERREETDDLFDRFDKHLVKTTKNTPVEHPSEATRPTT